MLAAEAMGVDEVMQTVFGERRRVSLKSPSTYWRRSSGRTAWTEAPKSEEQRRRNQEESCGGQQGSVPAF